MKSPADFYKEKFDRYSSKLTGISLKVKRFAWYRLISFAAIFLPLALLGWQWLTLPLSILLVVFFFFLIKKNIQLEKQKQKFSVLKKIVEDEQLALNHSFLHFQNGKEYLDTEHFFSYDLDLFGDGSIFQFLNRTSTISGRQKLAGWLIAPPKEKQFIDSRQIAIQELSLIPIWRLHFLANGRLFEETEVLSKEIRSWSEMELELNRPELVKKLILLIPAITVISILPAILGLSNVFLILMVFTQFVLMYFFWKRINQYFSFFGRKSELLGKYMQLLEFIEEREFRSEYFVELQKKVKAPSASKIFKQMKSLVKEFEYRQNILVGVVLNGLFLWDIRCVYKLWKWHRKHHKRLSIWIEVISEMDALISLGNYAYNNPGFAYPKIHNEGFSFEAKELGHPLLHPDKRVNNNMQINGWSKAMIGTGANMAGKSTFLRTVGVNLILARLGAPVCAEQMRTTPIEIYTNMRTTDSLLKDESYFFAELKRIKGVLDKLRSGERIFVILDEMLKGTNSIDKLNGSKELIR
ncbi:MAG: hypothetical protein R3182_00745, partial [Draconibacterium sp.]|nr:hypothetical protein [Draconibacterium sp.]